MLLILIALLWLMAKGLLKGFTRLLLGGDGKLQPGYGML